MLKQSYSTNYIQSYLWKFFAMTFGLISMLVVVPALSSNKATYGVYTVCISIGFFLSYADIGFYSAGLKYAAESFSAGDRESEYRILGFASFILFAMIVMISMAFLVLSFKPTLLIASIEGSDGYRIASRLLLIQAIFSFNYVISRLIDGIFGIRVEGYVFQKYQLVGNLLKICSILYFFNEVKYDVVMYFLFTKCVDLLVNFFGVLAIRKRYDYSLIKLMRAFRFDSSVYDQIKRLAFATFITTFLWVAFYEVDAIAIGKLLGVESVSIFAIGLILSNYFRSILTILYSPFQSRFNHFVGLKEISKLSEFAMKIVRLTMPIVVFSLVSIILLSRNIVLTWVGIDYLKSVLIIQFLMASYMLSFVTMPTAYLLGAMVNTKYLYVISVASVLIFWSGVIATIHVFGVYSFAVFKFLTCTVAALIYLNFLLQFLRLRLFLFLSQTVFHVVVPCFCVVLFGSFSKMFLPTTKGIGNLIVVIGAISCAIFVGFIALYISSRSYRDDMRHYFAYVINNFRRDRIA